MTTPTTAKRPRFIKASEGLSAKSRKAMSMPYYTPRQRHPDEATPPAICNGSMPSSTQYRTGDGEVRQAQRPGSAAALAIPSHGMRT
jgi:hypothetical protein